MVNPQAKAADKPLGDGTVLRRLVRLAAPYRWQYAFAIFLTLLVAVLSILQPAIIQRLIDQTIPEKDLNGLYVGVAVLIGVLLVQGVTQYLQSWYSSLLAQNIMNGLRKRVFGHLLSLRLKYYDTHPIGQLQTRTISDIEVLNNVFSEAFITIIGQLLQLMAILTVMFVLYDWQLVSVMLLVVPLFVLATQWFRRLVREAFQRERKYVAIGNAFLQEHITGITVTQLFNRTQAEDDRYENITRKHLKANLDTVLYYSIFFPVVELLSSLALALLVWYGGLRVLGGEVAGLGVLVALNLYASRMFRPIRMIAERFNDLQRGIVSSERVFRLLDTHEYIAAPPPNAQDAGLDAERLRITFEDVRFAYNPPEDILKGISFEVAPGTTTALVGATGSGKSTTISLLQRFYEPQSGRILLNNTPIEAFSKAALRQHLGLVLQDVFLFSGTIRDNITLNNPDISLEEVRSAAEAIGANRFIEALPGGYDYRLGERGLTLSAGQRQLLAFARVMVYDPKVLLLDEATANIDTETEVLIQRAIETVLKGRTSLIVAHRLSTIQHADQILVLHKGEIAERGTHQDLLAQNGLYKKLYLLQYGQSVAA